MPDGGRRAGDPLPLRGGLRGRQGGARGADEVHVAECVVGECAVGGATAHASDRGVLGAAAVLGEPRVPSARVDARERRDAVGVVHQLADAAPGPGRSELGRGGVQEARDLHLQEDVGHATVLCEMVWKVVLCPLGNEVCEETTTKVVVEPGYHYTLSIYSYLMVSAGKVVVSVSTMDVDAVPEFSVSAVPGDYFIQLTLGGAKYPLWGSCLCGGGERGGGLAVAGDVQPVRRACERECEHAHGSGDSGGAGVGVRACEREGEEAGAAVVHGEGGVDAGAESVGRGAGGGGGLAVPGAEGAVRVGVPRDVRGLVWLG